MNPIDIRDLALNLSELIAGLDSHRTRGPVLVTRDGEPEAVIIRHKAYAPRLHDFTQTANGDLVCRHCSPTHRIMAAPTNLGQALEAANAHWRDAHYMAARERARAGHPTAAPTGPHTPAQGPANGKDMANLPVTIRISTPLPVSVRDLPKLDKLAARAAYIHGVKPENLTVAQDGNDLVISYQVNAR